jgi:hypothetical protein
MNVKCLEYTAWVLPIHPWSLEDENNVNLKRKIFIYFNVNIQFKNYVAGYLWNKRGRKYAGTGWNRLIFFLKCVHDFRWKTVIMKLYSWWYQKCIWQTLVTFQFQMLSLSLFSVWGWWLWNKENFTNSSLIYYGCESWSLCKECKMEVRENIMPKRISESKKHERTRVQRKLHNKDHSVLYLFF